MEQDALDRIKNLYGVTPEQLPSSGNVWASSRKVKADLGVPEAGYRVTRQFRDEPPAGRESHYYVRVTQNNGQMSWSSPIYITPA